MAFRPHHEREPIGEPAKPVRDRYDKLMLFNACAGVFCGVVSSAIAVFAYLDAQAGQREADAKLAQALEQISNLARSSKMQAESLSGQVEQMRAQSKEMSNQTRSLGVSATAAQAQASLQRELALQSSRPALRVTVDDVAANGVTGEEDDVALKVNIENIGERYAVVDGASIEVVNDREAYGDRADKSALNMVHVMNTLKRETKLGRPVPENCANPTGVAIQANGGVSTLKCVFSSRRKIVVPKQYPLVREIDYFRPGLTYLVVRYGYRYSNSIRWSAAECFALERGSEERREFYVFLSVARWDGATELSSSMSDECLRAGRIGPPALRF